MGISGLENKLRGDEKYRTWSETFARLEPLNALDNLFGVICYSNEIQKNTINVIVEPLHFEPLLFWIDSNTGGLAIKDVRREFLDDKYISQLMADVLKNPNVRKMNKMVGDLFAKKRGWFSAGAGEGNHYWFDIESLYVYPHNSAIHHIKTPVKLNNKNEAIELMKNYAKMMQNTLIKLSDYYKDNAVKILAEYIDVDLTLTQAMV